MTHTLVSQMLGSYLVTDKRYPQPLPKELEEWYCYTSDGGHSILCALKDAYEKNSHDPASFLVPVPVKRVLREYWIQDGYVVVDVPYSSDVGLIISGDDDEF